MSSVETVSILISDLVGSTGLETRVGPAVANELRREHFSTLREAIDSAGGREVKNTGDGLMVVFESAAAGVECAVGMQQLLERRNRNADEQLSIRVGVSLGDATVEDGDYFGMPSIEAARLCDAAGSDQILTTELVRMICARGDQTFTPVGDLDLKGIPEPVAAFEVRWQPLGSALGGMPLPGRLHGVPPIGYVGREVERRRAAELWDAVRAGRRQALLISGEPGIGKTRLAAHTAVELHGSGAAVLFGHCSEELGAPYEPWIEALAHYVEHAPQEVLDEHAERRGGDLTRLVPRLASRVEAVPEPSASDPETERYLLFGAVLGLLEDASRDAPLVLVLDDLHWADAQSLALMRHVVAGSAGLKLMLLGTFRDSELDRQHPLTDVLAAMRREEGVDRLALSGLATEDVVAIMEAAAGHDMDETGLALAREIAAETDGNPFYVAELLRHLSESGVLTQRTDGRWELKGPLAEIGMPQSIREVVGRRVERLGDQTRQVLTMAAVIGREFDADLLERLAQEDEEELLDLLEGAVEAAVLVEQSGKPGAFAFSHALINHTLYEELGATRRARLHQHVAEALEDLCGGDPGNRVAELAHHWSAATVAVDHGKALVYSRQAAQRALAELAPGEAVRWFAHALELLEPDGDSLERCDVLIGLGEAQRQAGLAEYRTTLLDAGRLAIELGDPDRLARAALANSRGYTSEIGLVDDDRVQVLRTALDKVSADDPRSARLRSLLAMELHYGGELAERRALADEALAAARRADDATALAHVLIDRFFALFTAHTAAERRDVLVELEEVAPATGDPVIEYWTAVLGYHLGMENGDRARIEEAMRRRTEVSDRLGEPFLDWLTLWHRGSARIVTGPLDEADELAEQAVALGLEADQGDAMIIYVAQMTPVRREQGRMDELIDVLLQSVEENPGMAALSGALALAYAESGRDDDAAMSLDAAARQGFESIGLDITWMSAIALFADVAAHLRAPEPAATLYGLLEPFGDRMVWNGASPFCSASHYLGRLAGTLGRSEDAERHFAVAADAHERLHAPRFLARTRLDWAELRLERGDEDGARALAKQAAVSAAEGGAQPLEDRAEALLRTVGAAS
ncbi:MAG TPA: AAA family ATPase [Thermoleophilaceae bacterium]